MELEGSLPRSQERTTDPTLSQMNHIHTLKLSFFKTHYNFIHAKSPNWSLLLRILD
jgi:hypothetical protein